MKGERQAQKVASGRAFWGGEAYVRSRRERARVIYGITHHILSHHREGVWLDVGAGPGILKEALAEMYDHPIWGIERDADLLHTRHRMMLGDAQSLPFRNSSVDVIFFNHVLEHVPDPVQALREISRVLKPGGWLYVATPNFNWFWEVHYRLPFIHWLPRPLQNRLVRWLRGEEEFDVRLWPYARLVSTLEDLGYEVINLVPVLFYERPQFLRKPSWRVGTRVVSMIPLVRSWIASTMSPNIMILARKTSGPLP